MKNQKSQCRKPSPPPDEFYAEILTNYLERRIELSMADLAGREDVEVVRKRFRDAIGRIQCDDGAREAFSDFHGEGYELERELVAFFSDLAGECSRWREDAIQIAGLLAACYERCKSIDRNLTNRAIAIVRWCKKSFFNLILRHNPADTNDLLQKIVDINLMFYKEK